MAIRDLIPWSPQGNRLPASVSGERDPETHPLLSLHREMNRLFDDVFRSFGVASIASFDRGLSWPQVELAETDKEIRITAELPALDQKDVDIQVEQGVLTIRGEKKAEVEDKDRGYSERSYGYFERRRPAPQH